MPAFLLYSRPDCHLCDLAHALLSEQKIKFTSIDISNDEKLQDLYGLEIPVLVDQSGRVLLKGIFSLDRLKRVLLELKTD